MLGKGIDVPLEVDDYFRWRAYSSSQNATVTFYGRILQRSGALHPFAYNVNCPSSGAIQTVIVQAGAGILVGAAASVPIDSITAGSVNAVGEIGKYVGTTFTPHTLLFSGQLDDLTPLTSQVSAPVTPTNRVSFLFSNGTTPSAVPYSETITPPTGFRIRFTRVEFNYQCGAAAGTRFPVLYFRKNGISWQQVIWPLSRTAGQVGDYQASISGNIGTVSNIAAQPLAESLYFYDPIDIQIEDGAAVPAGGDTITAIRIRWEVS